MKYTIIIFNIQTNLNQYFLYYFFYNLTSLKKIWIKIRETPFYIKRIFSFLSTREGLRFFAFSAYNSVFFLGILIYILSPFDLIPEAIFGIFGFIDDLVALGFLIFVVGDLYYQYMIRRNMMHYHSNN